MVFFNVPVLEVQARKTYWSKRLLKGQGRYTVMRDWLLKTRNGTLSPMQGSTAVLHFSVLLAVVAMIFNN